MTLKGLLKAIGFSPTAVISTVSIAPTEGGGPELGAEFAPDATYIELRLTQMHLRDRREYWQEFIPLTSVLTELTFAGERQVIPFVVGPELLKGAQLFSGSDEAEYLDHRLAGPYPYTGGD